MSERLDGLTIEEWQAAAHQEHAMLLDCRAERKRIEAEALPSVERLAAVRRYVAGNCAIWGDDPADLLGLAIADVHQKILNVIDTGSPMPLASSAAEAESERRLVAEWDVTLPPVE